MVAEEAGDEGLGLLGGGEEGCSVCGDCGEDCGEGAGGGAGEGEDGGGVDGCVCGCFLGVGVVEGESEEVGR